MITGDAEDTAIAVASAVGFYDPLHHRTLSGAEVEGMSERLLDVRYVVVWETCEGDVYNMWLLLSLLRAKRVDNLRGRLEYLAPGIE